MASTGLYHSLTSSGYLPGTFPASILTVELLSSNSASNLFTLHQRNPCIQSWLESALMVTIADFLLTCMLSWHSSALLLVLVVILTQRANVRPKNSHYRRTKDLQEMNICSLSLAASMTALILQYHSQICRHPFLRLLLRTYLYVEMALNGTEQEKDQISSWFRWIHRHVDLNKTATLQAKFGVPEDIWSYTSFEDLNAYALQTLIWATIAYNTKHGGGLSGHTRDKIVFKYHDVGLQLGISEDLLVRDYASFVVSWDGHLNSLKDRSHLTHTLVRDMARFARSAKKTWLTDILIHAALMIGHDLLPDQVKEHYKLDILPSPWHQAIQKILVILFETVYPILEWLSLRGLITMMLVLEPSLRQSFKISFQEICSMDVSLDKPIRPQSSPDTTAVSHTTAAEDPLPSYLEWLKTS